MATSAFFAHLSARLETSGIETGADIAFLKTNLQQSCDVTA
jgi:hypothetical protein